MTNRMPNKGSAEKKYGKQTKSVSEIDDKTSTTKTQKTIRKVEPKNSMKSQAVVRKKRNEEYPTKNSREPSEAKSSNVRQKKKISKPSHESTKSTTQKQKPSREQSRDPNSCQQSSSAKKASSEKAVEVASQEKEDNLKSNLSGRLREFGKNMRKFVNRPIDASNLKRLSEKAREKQMNSAKIAPRSGESVFVSRKTLPVLESDPGLEKTAEEEDFEQPKSDGRSIMLVANNFDNNGKLMIRGMPFWTFPRQPTTEDQKGIEESVEVDADVILQVNDGTIKLKSMPCMPISLDPLAEVDVLKRRDKSFFNRDVIFANTLRSTINLCETITVLTDEKSRAERPKKLLISEPVKAKVYQKNSKDKFKVREEKFAPCMFDKMEKHQRPAAPNRSQQLFSDAADNPSVSVLVVLRVDLFGPLLSILYYAMLFSTLSLAFLVLSLDVSVAEEVDSLWCQQGERKTYKPIQCPEQTVECFKFVCSGIEEGFNTRGCGVSVLTTAAGLPEESCHQAQSVCEQLGGNSSCSLCHDKHLCNSSFLSVPFLAAPLLMLIKYHPEASCPSAKKSHEA
ncbi:unnamed protein product [Caenorhabditis auriculariae]|uniref:Uncharacterized protein n=1 Tax=Caenorhabditis auriculariae TaxID=2777116 RepID=A0A8S1HBL5_9PELO|nr:unnamed protein product [Caenorhabditis auriculariae]